MSWSTYHLEYAILSFGDHHFAQLCRCRHCCVYTPMSNTASHVNHVKKINSWVSFSFPYEYGAPLGGLKGHWSSAINYKGDSCRGNSMQFLSCQSCNLKIARVNQVRFSVRFVTTISQGFRACLKRDATKIASSCHNKSRLCKRALTLGRAPIRISRNLFCTKIFYLFIFLICASANICGNQLTGIAPSNYTPSPMSLL